MSIGMATKLLGPIRIGNNNVLIGGDAASRPMRSGDGVKPRGMGPRFRK
jgi:hypothetical protein